MRLSVHDVSPCADAKSFSPDIEASPVDEPLLQEQQWSEKHERRRKGSKHERRVTFEDCFKSGLQTETFEFPKRRCAKLRTRRRIGVIVGWMIVWAMLSAGCLFVVYTITRLPFSCTPISLSSPVNVLAFPVSSHQTTFILQSQLTADSSSTVHDEAVHEGTALLTMEVKNFDAKHVTSHHSDSESSVVACALQARGSVVIGLISLHRDVAVPRLLSTTLTVDSHYEKPRVKRLGFLESQLSGWIMRYLFRLNELLGDEWEMEAH